MAINDSNTPGDVTTAPENITPPEEKAVTDNAPLETGGETPAPEMSAEEMAALAGERDKALHDIDEQQLEPPAPFDIPDSGDVVVPFEKINEIVSGKQEAATEKTDAPPSPEDKAPDKKERGGKSKAEKSEKAPEADKPKKAERAPRPAKEPKPEKGSSDKTAEKEAPAAPTSPEPPQQPREAPRPNGKEEIVYINLAELHPFKNHPFGVRDDAEMKSLVESVRSGGVNQPALVRPIEGGGYEIIAGHRRQKASELAGPSEKAASIKMQFEAVKHQGTTTGQNVSKDELGKRSIEIVGQRNTIDGKPMNGKMVQRYIWLNNLVPDLKKAIDEGRLGFTSAVEISFIKAKNQNFIAVALESEQTKPSTEQAKRMRDLDKQGLLNGDVIDGILGEEKKEEIKSDYIR